MTIDTTTPASEETIEETLKDLKHEFHSLKISENENDILGNGSFGNVYSAYWGRTQVAVKSVKETAKRDLILVEASIMSRLRHPNIVEFWGIYEPNPTEIYLVMEKLECSMDVKLKEARQLKDKKRKEAEFNTLQDRIKWMADIALAFVYLHGQDPKLVHKDLKPNNVLIGINNIAKVADFGISRNQRIDPSATQPTMVPKCGNFLYKPPEAYLKNFSSQTSYDVYSYAMTIYEMLFLLRPFEEAIYCDDRNLKQWTVGGIRPPLDKVILGKEEDDRFKNLIKKCWAQKIEDRPEFSEILKLIREWPEMQAATTPLEQANDSGVSSVPVERHPSTASIGADGQPQNMLGENNPDPPVMESSTSAVISSQPSPQSSTSSLVSLSAAAVTTNHETLLNLLTQECKDEKDDDGSLGVLSQKIDAKKKLEWDYAGQLIEMRFKDKLPLLELKSIASFTGLRELSLQGMTLNCHIPKEFGNLLNLKYLSLNNNRLTGDIPESIWKLPRLKLLHLNHNKLTGEIPESIPPMLEDLYLHSNKFSGKLPKFNDSLITLYLNDNDFEGSVESINNLTKLTKLGLGNNRLTGNLKKAEFKLGSQRVRKEGDGAQPGVKQQSQFLPWFNQAK